jgi:hypothetical protein
MPKIEFHILSHTLRNLGYEIVCFQYTIVGYWIPNQNENRQTGKKCFPYGIDLYYFILETKSIVVF